MIKPTESVLDIERGLSEFNICIRSPCDIEKSKAATGWLFTGCIFPPVNHPDTDHITLLFSVAQAHH
jgi:hypothetical protein